MFSLLAIAAIANIVQDNLVLFAIGHIGIVVILFIMFCNMNSNKPPKEPTEKDEDAFDYGTEDGSLFKSNSEGSIPLNALKENEESEREADDNLEGPIVFNSQINDDNLPVADVESSEDEDTSDEEEISEESAEQPEEDSEPKIKLTNPDGEAEESEADSARRKELRIKEILEQAGDDRVIAISREEVILDINPAASELFSYTKDDVAGKKIDEIIFLKENADSSSQPDSESYQQAKGLKKDGSQFPTMVELEMADREFGIIAVTLHTSEEGQPLKLNTDESEAIIDDQPAQEAAEEEKDEPEVISVPEPEPEPVVVEQKPARPLPPPPRPKTTSQSLALQQTAGTVSPVASGKQLDSKTMEMFSSQLSQPLQSITQMAELIASDENAIPHLKKYAVAIQAKSNRMMSQIEEMSMLVSAQKSNIEVKDHPFNLGNMLTTLVDIAGSASDEAQKIHFQRGEQDLIVMSDEEHLEKVISNLLNITINCCENQDIELHVQSEIVEGAQNIEKTINFNGQNLEISSIRKLNIFTQFPGDEHTNRFLDVSVNRPDNPLVQKLQSSSSLKNHMASIRLMKELAKSLGGKLKFSTTEQNIAELNLEAKLPCAEVAAFPS